MQQHQCHQHHRRHGVALHSRQPGMPFQAFDAFLSRPKKEVKRPTTCRCLVGVATDCCVFFFLQFYVVGTLPVVCAVRLGWFPTGYLMKDPLNRLFLLLPNHSLTSLKAFSQIVGKRD